MMPYEIINTMATVGTFLVISATAIAAIVQLRHMRASNQLEGLLSVNGRIEDDDFNAWFTQTQEQLPALMENPDYRAAVEAGRIDRNAPWLKLGNSYDAAGNLIKRRLLPEDIFLDNAAYRVIAAWEMLEPFTAVIRRTFGAGLWENFEYLYVRSQHYHDKHPNGTYPHNEQRAVVRDRYLEEDRRGKNSAAENGAKSGAASVTSPPD